MSSILMEEPGCWSFLQGLKAYRRKKSEMAYKRTVLDSPAVNQTSYIAGAKKHVGYRNCLMYLSQDSGYNESLKAFSPDSGESSSDSLESGSPSQDYENSENIDPTTLKCSPIRKISLEPEVRSKSGSYTTEMCETPRVAKKDFSLRRRLLLSKATSGGNLDFEALDSSDEMLGRKTTVQRIPSFEEGLSINYVDSPRDGAYKPIATSTLKMESDSSMSCKKWRVSFAQQRSSTIDEIKGDTVPFPEVENLSPVQHSTESTDDSILSVNEANLTELHATPTHNLISNAKEAFQTPISNLAASFRFNLCTPTGTPVTDLDNSITEDSAFHSLSLDKSQDSITDHEGSFQELIQKQKETPKSTHNKNRLRKLDRCRRLSTLRERGSQSEVEEEIAILSSSYKSKMIRNSVTEQSEFSFDDSANNSLLKVEDLTGTPALRVVRDMVVRSTRKRVQRATMQELLSSLDCSDVSEDELTRLIGRKMGLEQLDILSELKYRNLKHIITFIFKVLNVESICSIWKVSKEWREMVIQDKDSYQRRKLFLKKLRHETEHGWIFFSADAATRLNLLNRSALKSVQAQAKSVFHTPTSCGFLTPKGTAPISLSVSKQQEYVKIAKTLFADEALKPCPQCQYPAKYQPLKKRGKCSKKDCGFDFCVLCLCAFHGSKECSGGSGKRVHNKDAIPGSAQSKRSLKRL